MRRRSEWRKEKKKGEEEEQNQDGEEQGFISFFFLNEYSLSLRVLLDP